MYGGHDGGAHEPAVVEDVDVPEKSACEDQGHVSWPCVVEGHVSIDGDRGIEERVYTSKSWHR